MTNKHKSIYPSVNMHAEANISRSADSCCNDRRLKPVRGGCSNTDCVSRSSVYERVFRKGEWHLEKITPYQFLQSIFVFGAGGYFHCKTLLSGAASCKHRYTSVNYLVIRKQSFQWYRATQINVVRSRRTDGQVK